ncbi:MAG: TIGR03960 family B12-binding radical SAM protein [Candidatus Eisenbacteria bacterium]
MSAWKDVIFDLLPHVSKPSRYLPPVKNGRGGAPAGAEVRWALLFPDVAESGYSHHGLEILYHLVHGLEGAAAERAFFPWTDMEERMRERGVPLFSSESYRPLREFDLLGITLQFELSCTNVVASLDLAGLPRRAAARKDPFPLVAGGGPCAMNPEPLAPFFDLFLLGDGEEGVIAITSAVGLWKREGDGKKESLLAALAGVPGVYVPSLYKMKYGPDGRLAGAEGPPVRRLALADVTRFPAPEAPVVPAVQPIHDRVYAEIARGCGVGCRFCQAGMIYRPLRERPKEEVVAAAAAAVRSTGHEDVSLASLSTGDHAEILPMMRLLNDELKGERVGISLPSLRASTLTDPMIAEVARHRKTGFTIAPEAGSERMLRLINKGIAREDVIRTAERAAARGWDILKLYFLIGLPTEEDEDLEGIASLSEEVWRAGKRAGRRGLRLNVSVSSLVPKPHTPFQWERQDGIAEIERKQRVIRERMPRTRDIALKCHNPYQTHIEGVLSRGDRKVADAIEAAVDLGARFDEWSEMFSHDRWMQAFERAGVDPEEYLRERHDYEVLPWDHIDSGIAKRFLLRERGRARTGRFTPFCREECRVCRTCGDDLFVIRGKDAGGNGAGGGGEETAAPEPEPPREAKLRLRFRYAKEGDFRFLSHLELGRLFRMALRRTGLPIAYSRGFHPHVRVAFGPALPVGYAGAEEPIEFLFHAPVLPEEAERSLNEELPPPVRVFGGEAVPLRGTALDALPMEMEYEVIAPEALDYDRIAAEAERFADATEVWGEKTSKKGKTRRINLREAVVDLRADRAHRRISITMGSGGRVTDVLRILAGGGEEARSLRVRRARAAILEEAPAQKD